MAADRRDPDARCADALAEGAPVRLHRFDAARQCVPSLPGFTGVRVHPDAISPAEAEALLAQIGALPFKPSQSGKQKQHYGPRVNFMRRRMNADRFEGLPDWARHLEQRLRARVADDRTGDPSDLDRCHAALAAFETTDVFVLRYDAREQSNLDFHVDDLYAYGEAILDLSLGSDSTLTFLGPLDDEHPPCGPDLDDELPPYALQCVRVPLPARSLAVVYGPARFAWQHAVLPADIRGVRTSITLRTLAPALRSTEAGRTVLARARRAAPPAGCQATASPAD